MADEETTEEQEVERQVVTRMPSGVTPGPYFPSGMSAPEAAMAGANRGMTDEQKEQIAKMAEAHGFEPGERPQLQSADEG